MTFNFKSFSCSCLVLLFLGACAPQSTPSMMNVSPVELVYETTMEQVPLNEMNDVTYAMVASQYSQKGNGSLDLTMTYDPKSKNFTAMKAVHALKSAEKSLQLKGVHNITKQTLPVPDGKPSLMVSYDTVRAQAPSDCGNMPGLNTNETSRFIGDYKFGCGIETLLAKQIARPSDLAGNDQMDVRSARRDSVIINDYSKGVPNQRLEGIERDDLVSSN